MASTKKDITFIAGMRGSTLKPGDADKLLKRYLSAEATLSTQTRRWISDTRPIKPKSPLTELVLEVAKRQIPKIEKDGRELLDQVKELVGEVTERIEAMDAIETTLEAQLQIAEKGSEASKEAGEYVKFLKEARTKPEEMLKSIKVPTSGAKPEAFAKQLCDATAACIAIGILLDVAAKGLKKFLR